jgi:hypothetical protein
MATNTNYIYMHIHIHACILQREAARLRVVTNTDTYIYTHIHACVLQREEARLRVVTNAYTYIYAHIHACILQREEARLRVVTNAYTYIYAHIHACVLQREEARLRVATLEEGFAQSLAKIQRDMLTTVRDEPVYLLARMHVYVCGCVTHACFMCVYVHVSRAKMEQGVHTYIHIHAFVRK